MLAGYLYYQKINITGQAGASTNYIVRLRIGESAGAAANDFHLAGHCTAFPHDIRFTDDDSNTLLYAMLENISGAAPNRIATVHVLVTDDLSANQFIYCFYGNANALRAWDILNTSPTLADDFDEPKGQFAQDCVCYATGNDMIGPQSVYNSGVKKTFHAIASSAEGMSAIYFDHATKLWSNEVLIQASVLPPGDGHGQPAMIQTADGKFHVFGNCHDTQMQYWRSNAANDISAWTNKTAGLPAGTALASYPNPVEDAAGNIYLFYRKQLEVGVRNAEFFTKSADGGDTWAAEVEIIEAIVQGGDGRNIVYTGGWLKRVGDKIPLSWIYYTKLPEAYDGIFAAYLDTTNDHLYGADGFDMGVDISRAEADAHCRITSTSDALAKNTRVRMDASGNMYVIYVYNDGVGNIKYWFCYWTGAAWTAPQAITTTSGHTKDGDFEIISPTNIVAYLSVVNDIEEWMWDGANWAKTATVAAGASYDNSILDPYIVANYDPLQKVTFGQNLGGNENKAFCWGSQGLVGEYLGYVSDAALRAAWASTKNIRSATTVFEGKYSMSLNEAALGTPGYRSFAQPSTLFIVESAIRLSRAGDNINYSVADATPHYAAFIDGGYPTSGHWGYLSGGDWIDSGVANAINTWYWTRLIVDVTNKKYTFRISTDGITWTTVVNNVNWGDPASSANRLICAEHYGFYDIVRIRKYVDPEPAFSSSGGEPPTTIPIALSGNVAAKMVAAGAI